MTLIFHIPLINYSIVLRKTTKLSYKLLWRWRKSSFLPFWSSESESWPEMVVADVVVVVVVDSVVVVVAVFGVVIGILGPPPSFWGVMASWATRIGFRCGLGLEDGSEVRVVSVGWTRIGGTPTTAGGYTSSPPLSTSSSYTSSWALVDLSEYNALFKQWFSTFFGSLWPPKHNNEQFADPLITIIQSVSRIKSVTHSVVVRYTLCNSPWHTL